MKSNRICILILILFSLTLCVPSLCCWQNARYQIRITSVLQKNVSASHITVKPNALGEVGGEVSNLPATSADDYTVYVILRTPFDGQDDQWTVVGASKLTPTSTFPGKRVAHWSVSGVRFPNDDYSREFGLFAILVQDSYAQLEVGEALDHETMSNNALASASPLYGTIRYDEPIPLDKSRRPRRLIPPLIGIDYVVNVLGVPEKPRQDTPIEVGWTAQVHGEIDMKEGKFYPRLVVQPSGEEKKWVMPPVASTDTYVNEIAYLGRPGLDNRTRFRVFAILSRVPLRYGSYNAASWLRVEKTLVAQSRPVTLRRVVGPGNLVIEAVDATPVNGKDVVTVEPGCQVEGGINDDEGHYPLSAKEAIYVLTRPKQGPGSEEWTVSGLAIITVDGGYSWRIPHLRGLKPGLYRLLAISSKVRLTMGSQINPDAWYTLAKQRQVKRLSPVVTINVQKNVSSPNATQ